MALGNFDPGRKTGPAIWLKCAVAGVLPDVDLGGQVPVICLPGVSRADLRAIEDCPQEPQPLAELQYRGAYWSQANTKDWSPNAFLDLEEWRLGSRRVPGPCDAGGVDQGTSGRRSLGALSRGPARRPDRCCWLDSGLPAPNPTRDILAWLNGPVAAQSQWKGARWDIFATRCRKDYGFDPDTDGPVTAAEKLAARQGAWATVWGALL